LAAQSLSIRNYSCWNQKETKSRCFIY